MPRRRPGAVPRDYPLASVDPPPPPERATEALPGSPEKIAAMAARWASRRQIHHAGDGVPEERRDGADLRRPRGRPTAKHVYWVAAKHVWQVLVRRDRKLVHVGKFRTFQQAVAGRDAWLRAEQARGRSKRGVGMRGRQTDAPLALGGLGANVNMDPDHVRPNTGAILARERLRVHRGRKR